MELVSAVNMIHYCQVAPWLVNGKYEIDSMTAFITHSPELLTKCC